MYIAFTKIIVLRYGGKYSLGSSGVIGLKAAYQEKIIITSSVPPQTSLAISRIWVFVIYFFRFSIVFLSTFIFLDLLLFFHILEDLDTFPYKNSEQDIAKILALKIVLMRETECDDNQPDRSDNT